MDKRTFPTIIDAIGIFSITLLMTILLSFPLLTVNLPLKYTIHYPIVLVMACLVVGLVVPVRHIYESLLLFSVVLFALSILLKDEVLATESIALVMINIFGYLATVVKVIRGVVSWN